MARSALFILALLGRVSGDPAAEGTCTGPAEECKGHSMLQTAQMATVTAADGLEDDLLQGVYADLAASLAGEEAILEGEGADDEGADLLEQPGGDSGGKDIKETSSKCICGKEKFRGDAVIDAWKYMSCEKAFSSAWVAKKCQLFKPFLSTQCCGEARGCDGMLCPRGADLLPEKKSHTHGGKQFFCKNMARWFERGAKKGQCRHLRATFAPKCCTMQGYGYGSASEEK